MSPYALGAHVWTAWCGIWIMKGKVQENLIFRISSQLTFSGSFQEKKHVFRDNICMLSSAFFLKKGAGTHILLIF
jgi:hypothetical protein